MDRNNFWRQFVINNWYFFIPFFILLFIFCSLTVLYGNSAVFHIVNNAHSPFTDFLFVSFSDLGDGLLAFMLVFILLWISFREALTLLVITLIIITLIAVFKRYLFIDFHRPLFYFGEQMIRIVPGYNPPKLHTFPSGHTATAFSVYLYLSFLARNNSLKFSLFLVAALIGYSRIYLAAHFPADVIGGSVLATLVTVVVYVLSRRINNSWIDQRLIINFFRGIRRQTA